MARQGATPLYNTASQEALFSEVEQPATLCHLPKEHRLAQSSAGQASRPQSEEYAYQASKFRQDKDYFGGLVSEVAKLVQIAKLYDDG